MTTFGLINELFIFFSKKTFILSVALHGFWKNLTIGDLITLFFIKAKPNRRNLKNMYDQVFFCLDSLMDPRFFMQFTIY